jgi:hypothetical protein
MGFLHKVASEIYSQHGRNLSHVTVILPTQRASYFFKRALLGLNETLWFPRISTLREWIENKSGLQKIDSLSEVIRLHKISTQLGRHEALDEFLPLGRTLCSDFDELDLHMVNPEWFFMQLRHLASMKVYEPAAELSPSQREYLKFWEHFEKLYFLSRSALLAENIGTQGMMYRKVAENIIHIAEHLKDFYFVGFDGLTKTEEVILKHFHSHNKATVFWDADSYYVHRSELEAGLFFRKYLREWKGNIQYCEPFILSHPLHVEVISVARSMGQVMAAAEIVANRLPSVDTSADTAIILTDEKLLQPLQYALPQSLSQANLTMGLPISRSLAGEFFLLLFQLHDSSERMAHRFKKTKLYYKDFIALLQHPFFNIFLHSGYSNLIAADIRKRNIVFIDKSYLENSSIAGGSEWINSLFPEQNAQAYLAVLSNFSLVLIEHFKTRSSIDIHLEFLLKIYDAIHSLEKILQHVSLTTKSIRKLLTDEFKNQRVPFEGEPAEGLQIMGLLESRCLDFENVIILSANEGLLPPNRSEKSYIPHPLRQEALFSYRQKEAKIAYLFYRLLHRAKRIFLLYDTEMNQVGGGEKSRFILQLQYELAKQAPLITVSESVYSISLPRVSPACPISVDKNDQILSKLYHHASFGISPSALAVFIHCSLQYYFRYIANLKEPDEVEEKIESSTMGSAIHYVLEQLYQPMVGNRLSTEWLRGIIHDKERIALLLKKGLEETIDEEALMQGKNHLQYRLSLKMIYSFLENELARIESGENIELQALETPLETHVLINGQTVKLKGFADRIERQHGVPTVVDYKSGYPKAMNLKVDAIDKMFESADLSVPFQVLIYAWIFMKMNQGVANSIQSGIFWLQRTNNGFDKLTFNGDAQLNHEKLSMFEERLMQLLNKLFDRNDPFRQTEDIKRCRYCLYKGICQR